MRLVLVIEETSFYHPDFMASFIGQCEDQIVAVALVTKVPDKSNLELYMRKHWYFLKVSEMVKLGAQKAHAKLMDRLCRSGSGRFYSVRTVLEYFGIAYFEVKNNINRSCYLQEFAKLNADVIISSNSLIFGEKLLAIPNLCCINRHSALLPSYGGLWPVFQAYRSGETQTGVTIHTMEKAIDKGRILSRKIVPIKPVDTIAHLYSQCFELSVDALLEALNGLRTGHFPAIDDCGVESYYSMPTKQHWQQFRERGGRFI